jgi:hypothetical protein
MKTIKIGEKTSYQIKNANIIGFFIMIYAVADAVNHTPVLVPDKAKISVNLRQAGFNDKVLDGLVRSLWRGTAKRLDKAGATTYMGTREIAAAAGGTAAIEEWTYKILFPTTIIMNGNDEMEVEVEFPTDALTTHSTSLSYLGIREIHGTGSQFFIPKIKEYTLPALETKYEKYLGDNILRVVFMGGTTNGCFDDGLTQVEFTSDRRDDIVDTQEIVYETTANGNKGLIVLSEEHDQVKIKATMDGTSNAAGELKMVVTDYYIDAVLATTGARREKNHEAKLKDKASS